MRRSTAWILSIALALSVGYNLYQKVSFNRLYWRWGTTLTDRLINRRIWIDEAIAEPSDKRGASAYSIQEAPKEIRTLGENLDLMLSQAWPFPKTALGRIGWELNMFTVGVWNRSGTPVANMYASNNQVPDVADLSRLSRVYRIYAEHFPNDVVLSQSTGRHRKALIAAHEQIHSEGLDQLLPDIIRSNVMNPNPD